MEIDKPSTTPGPAAEPKKEVPNVTPPKDFDIDAYLSGYTGHTRIYRLLFMAGHSKELEAECTKRALDELKKSQNVAYVDEPSRPSSAQSVQSVQGCLGEGRR